MQQFKSYSIICYHSSEIGKVLRLKVSLSNFSDFFYSLADDPQPMFLTAPAEPLKTPWNPFFSPSKKKNCVVKTISKDRPASIIVPPLLLRTSLFWIPLSSCRKYPLCSWRSCPRRILGSRCYNADCLLPGAVWDNDPH